MSILRFNENLFPNHSKLAPPKGWLALPLLKIQFFCRCWMDDLALWFPKLCMALRVNLLIIFCYGQHAQNTAWQILHSHSVLHQKSYPLSVAVLVDLQIFFNLTVLRVLIFFKFRTWIRLFWSIWRFWQSAWSLLVEDRFVWWIRCLDLVAILLLLFESNRKNNHLRDLVVPFKSPL